jgi:hypothetical protein
VGRTRPSSGPTGWRERPVWPWRRRRSIPSLLTMRRPTRSWRRRGATRRESKAEIGVSAFLSTCPLRLTAVLSPYCKRTATGLVQDGPQRTNVSRKIPKNPINKPNYRTRVRTVTGDIGLWLKREGGGFESRRSPYSYARRLQVQYSGREEVAEGKAVCQVFSRAHTYLHPLYLVRLNLTCAQRDD